MRIKFTPPLTIGVLLWGAATALLLEEAMHQGRFDVSTLSIPVVTAATVASACLAHLRLAKFRLIGGAGFALLAILGSTIMATGTLGRLAEAQDSKASTVHATNRDYGFKVDELKAAKIEAARECRSIGKKCEAWNARVDKLTGELAGVVVKSSDPKADAIARLATLVGGNGPRVKEIVSAFDPALLPLFLELGSVGFFAGAFGHRRNREQKATVSLEPTTVVLEPQPTVKVWSKDAALADFQGLKHSGAQYELAERWGVGRGTASRWLRDWEDQGLVDRQRLGREKATVLALPAPRKGRLS